jgi:hypothetical protein
MPEVYREFLEALSKRGNGNGVREFLQVLVLGRSYGQDNLELAMMQALSENRADVDWVKQLVYRSNYINMIPSAQVFPDHVKVILPDLSRFDELRLITSGGGN